MSDNLQPNKKDFARINPSGIRSNVNIHNGLYEIKELCHRPTTAAENAQAKPPKPIHKKSALKDSDPYKLLVNKQRLTLSNGLITSKDSESNVLNPSTALGSRKPVISPVSYRPVTYNPNPLNNMQRKINPRTLSLPRKSEETLLTEGLPKYSIKSIIGRGAYAIVRLAQHVDTGKKVAIKTYDKYQVIDPAKKLNMLREIEILKKIEHPHIVKLYETVETSKHFHLILEYVAGSSLYGYIKAKPNSSLEEVEAKRIFKQILSALEYCHSRGIAHRDIKLDNILLDNKFNVKIIDFGFSTMNSSDEKSRVFCGTPSYMAPEIVMRKDYYGMQTDVWALGILLYVMVCGKMPFKAYNDKELYRRIEKGMFSLPNGFQDSLKGVINKMLEVNPRKRPSIKALIEDEWVSSSGILRSTTQNFQVKHSNESASLDLDVISGIKKFGFTEDQILKDIHNEKSQVSLLYKRLKSRGRDSIDRYFTMKDNY